jgi:hypothetical protein
MRRLQSQSDGSVELLYQHLLDPDCPAARQLVRDAKPMLILTSNSRMGMSPSFPTVGGRIPYTFRRSGLIDIKYAHP